MLHLTVPSDPSWVSHALRDLPAVLADHAHCELKAASNALSMAARHASDPEIVKTLTDLAREEIDHFQQVHAQLIARGIPLGTPPVDPYVASLRRAHATLGPSPVTRAAAGGVDRLLTCALIEARSCERFDRLSAALVDVEPELSLFYSDLRSAEARHYRTFVDLAVRAADGDETSVLARLGALASAEGAIVKTLTREPNRSTVHG